MKILGVLRLLIDLAGTLFLVAYLFAAVWMLARTRDLTRTRLLVADGILFALSFKTAATCSEPPNSPVGRRSACSRRSLRYGPCSGG